MPTEPKPVSITDRRAAKTQKAAPAGKSAPAPEQAPAPAAESAPAVVKPPARDPGAVLAEVKVAKLGDIAPNPLNPRTDLDAAVAAAAEALADKRDPADMEETDPARPMAELITSMKARGQLQSVVVMLATDFRKLFAGTEYVKAIPRGRDFVIIGGGRRYAAAKPAGLTELNITVLHGDKAPKTQKEFLALSVAENVQRESLSVVATARAVMALSESGASGKEVAGILGKTDAWVSQYKKIGALPADILTIIDSAPFSRRQALDIASIQGDARQLHRAEVIRWEITGKNGPKPEPAPEPAAVQGDGADQSDGDGPEDPTPNKGGRKAQTPEQKTVKAIRKLIEEVGRDALFAGLCEALEDFRDRAELAHILTDVPETADGTDPAPADN